MIVQLQQHPGPVVVDRYFFLSCENQILCQYLGECGEHLLQRLQFEAWEHFQVLFTKYSLGLFGDQRQVGPQKFGAAIRGGGNLLPVFTEQGPEAAPRRQFFSKQGIEYEFALIGEKNQALLQIGHPPENRTIAVRAFEQIHHTFRWKGTGDCKQAEDHQIELVQKFQHAVLVCLLAEELAEFCRQLGFMERRGHHPEVITHQIEIRVLVVAAQHFHE